MTRDDQYRRDLESLGGPREIKPEQPPVELTEADIAKADDVLTALRSAGLRYPFAVDTDNAEVMWATQLQPYPMDVLAEVITAWIAEPGTDFPSVGDVRTIADRIINRRAAIARGADRKETGPCPECDGDEYIYTYPEGGTGGVYPCRRCQPERWEAWQSNPGAKHRESVGPR